MNITEEYVGKSGVKYIFEYQDADSFEHLEYEKCRQAYGVCFYEEQIVIGFGGQKNAWGLIGGTIEKGETFEKTLTREIQEESNMEVLSCLPIGYQKMTDTRDGTWVYQLRYACKVKPHGPFTKDPAGSITETKLIDPQDYKQYFDWQTIGDHVISRALELKQHLR